MKKINLYSMLSLATIVTGVVNSPVIIEKNRSENLALVFKNKIVTHYKQLKNFIKTYEEIWDKVNNHILSLKDMIDQITKYESNIINEHIAISKLLSKFLNEVNTIEFLQKSYEYSSYMSIKKQLNSINYAIDYVLQREGKVPVYYLDDPIIFIRHVWDESPTHLLNIKENEGIMQIIYNDVNNCLDEVNDFINDENINEFDIIKILIN